MPVPVLFEASSVLCSRPTPHLFRDGFVSSTSRRGPHPPKRIGRDEAPPRFRHVPFIRNGVSDHGRAVAPRVTVRNMLPSTLSTASASATLSLSRLNIPLRMIAVYASRPSSPNDHATLATGRHATALPSPDFHRLERASFAWRTDNRFNRDETGPSCPPCGGPPSFSNVPRHRGRCRCNPRHLQPRGRVVGRHRAASAISWDNRQREGAGTRPHNRRMEAATVSTMQGDPAAARCARE